jgi:hypothetical protein
MSALSYRTGLARIGIPASATVSYLNTFASRPKSLRKAIRSMDFPASSDWSETPDINRDEDWTDEVQGVAWDGSHWLFSCNARQSKPGTNDKALYVFPSGSDFMDGSWSQMLSYKDVPHPDVGVTTHESDDHWGQLTFFEGQVFVSHMWDTDDPHFPSTCRAFVFDDNGGSLSFSRWFEIENPVSPKDGRSARAELQGINPWDKMLYTCFGGGEISEFFIHERIGLNAGDWTGEVLPIVPSVTHVQGATFTPNGHLFISTNETRPGDPDHQMIYYHSALNGHRLGEIPVLADIPNGTDGDELEGLCYAPLIAPSGEQVWIHAVLLENHKTAIDDIFLKQWACARPDVI